MARHSDAPHWLAGRRVALAGRLASLTRTEAARLVEAHGGILARSIARTPAALIVGRSGWPSAKNGRMSRKLWKAMRLVEQGHDVRIIPEEELLAELLPHNDRLRRGSTLSELAQLLRVSLHRLESWLRAGLIAPVREVDGVRYFDFGQVAGAKSLCELTRAGVTTARLRRSLDQLQRWRHAVDPPLSQLTTLEQGTSLVVRLRSGQLAEPCGQMLLDFAAPATDQPPAALPWKRPERSLEEWLTVAQEAEAAGDLPRAAHAFRQALMLGGPTAETCFNLANVQYSLGQFARSEERYRQAIEMAPDFWEAWNNLATVLSYQGQNEEAVETYYRALALNPNYADAHYNLADTLEDLGRWQEAREHWQAYLALEPHGQWAEHAQQRLRAKPR